MFNFVKYSQILISSNPHHKHKSCGKEENKSKHVHSFNISKESRNSQRSSVYAFDRQVTETNNKDGDVGVLSRIFQVGTGWSVVQWMHCGRQISGVFLNLLVVLDGMVKFWIGMKTNMF